MVMVKKTMMKNSKTFFFCFCFQKREKEKIIDFDELHNYFFFHKLYGQIYSIFKKNYVYNFRVFFFIL